MAVVTTPTKLSSLDEIINSELISSMLNLAVNTPFLYSSGGRTISIEGAATRTYAHPTFPKLAAAAALTETDEVGSVEITPSETTTSTTLVAQATFLSDQAAGASILNAAQLAVNRCVDAVRTKIDNDWCGLSASASNSQGDNSVTHSITNHDSVMVAVRAQMKAPGVVGHVIHPDAARDLNASAHSGGAPFWATGDGVALAGAVKGPNQGMWRATNDGAMVAISDRIPTADTSGWGNIAFEMGAANPLAIVLKRNIMVETWREVKRQGVWFVATADYGAGILDQSRCYEFITKT